MKVELMNVEEQVHLGESNQLGRVGNGVSQL